MGTRTQRRRTKIEGAFAPRLVEMIASPAFRALSLTARKILDRLEIELAHHGGKDNGRLPCTYEHFQEYGMDRDAIAPAIRELVALGFAEITQAGSAGNAEFRRPNLFRLTYLWTEFAPTHEWRRVTNEAEADTLARTARKTIPRRPVTKNQTQSGKLRSKPPGKTPTEKRKSPVGETPTTAVR